MKTIFKDTFLAFFFTIYCLSVFSLVTVPSFESKLSDQKHSEEVYFTELSKVLFPQAINADGNGVSIVHLSTVVDSGIDEDFAATQFLCKLIRQSSVNYIKESKALTLQFRAEDIIFPFHNFW